MSLEQDKKNSGIRAGAWALAWALACLSCAGAADIPDDSVLVVRPGRVTAAPVAPVLLSPDNPGQVEFSFRVAPGFHINSNRPKGDLLQPTTLKLSPPTDILVGKVKYPEGKDLSLAFQPGEVLNVYTGEFTISAMVTTLRDIPLGTYRVRAVLKYQACDNRQCYPPKEVPTDFDVKVQRKRTVHGSGNPGQSPHVHR